MSQDLSPPPPLASPNLFQYYSTYLGISTNTVLIADEESHVCDGLSVAVRLWAQEEQINIETIRVANGQQAVDYVHRIEDRNQLLLAILDLRMPDMNGLETAERINDLYPQTPIIITASYDETDEQLIQAADDFANENSHIGFVIRTNSSPLLKVALEFEIRKLITKEDELRQEHTSLFRNLRGQLSQLLKNIF